MVTKEAIDWLLAGRGARSRADSFPFNSLNLLGLSLLQHTHLRIWAISHIRSDFD